jgi:WD40 repeat protein
MLLQDYKRVLVDDVKDKSGVTRVAHSRHVRVNGGAFNVTKIARCREPYCNQFLFAQIHALGWSHSGKYIATGSADHSASVFHVSGSVTTRECELKGHTDNVELLAWHPRHEHTLVTLSFDKTFRIWDFRASR